MDKYLDKVNLGGGLISGTFFGILEVNSEFKCKIVEDLCSLNFNSLYAHLLIKFYDAGIFERNGINIDISIIDEVRRYFFIRNNMNSFTKEEYRGIKIWINTIYNNDLREYTPMIFELYKQYMRQFWDDFIEENKFGWLYIDTDCAFVSGGLKSLDLVRSIGIPFDLLHHDFFYLEDMKKYVLSDSGNIKVNGHRFKPEEVIGIMKSKLRNKKIDLLLG